MSIKMSAEPKDPVDACVDQKRGRVVLAFRLANRVVRFKVQPWVAGMLAKKIQDAIPTAQHSRCTSPASPERHKWRISCETTLSKRDQLIIEAAGKIASWGLKPNPSRAFYHVRVPYTLDEAFTAAIAFLAERGLSSEKLCASYAGEDRFEFHSCGPDGIDKFLLEFRHGEAVITKTSYLGKVRISRDPENENWDKPWICTPALNGHGDC